MVWNSNNERDTDLTPMEMRSKGDARSRRKQKTPWPLVRKRAIPTDRPPLVDEI
jgi:hypothetical protein